MRGRGERGGKRGERGRKWVRGAMKDSELIKSVFFDSSANIPEKRYMLSVIYVYVLHMCSFGPK